MNYTYEDYKSRLCSYKDYLEHSFAKDGTVEPFLVYKAKEKWTKDVYFYLIRRELTDYSGRKYEEEKIYREDTPYASGGCIWKNRNYDKKRSLKEIWSILSRDESIQRLMLYYKSEDM